MESDFEERNQLEKGRFLLLKKSLDPSDFDFFKQMSPSIFQKLIESSPEASSLKILDFFVTNSMQKNPKNCWLEPVREIHKSLFHSKPNKPIQLSLTPSKYTSLEKMLYAFGDYRIPDSQSVEKVNQGLVSLIDTLLSDLILSKIFKKNPKRNTHNLEALHRYLKFMFPKEEFIFYSIKTATKTITSIPDKDDESENEEEEKEFVENNSEKEKESIKFAEERTDLMDEQQFIEFSECRTINLMSDGKEKYLNLIKFDKWKHWLDKCKYGRVFRELEFINFVLCRLLKEIVELAIYEKCGKLQIQNNYIQPFYYESAFDKIQDKLIVKNKLFLKKKLSFEEKALKLFEDEYFKNGFNEIYGTKVRLVRKNNGEIDFLNRLEEKKEMESAREIWLGFKHEKKYWIKRIIAEEFVRNCKNEKPVFPNEYSNFLWNKHKIEKINDFSSIFKEYLLGKIGFKTSKVSCGKLESIYD